MFAHRGGAKLAPENTFAAFDRGFEHGVDGLECDVHLSRDGIPVVIHDRTLDRTTDATGPVSALTAEELSRVDAGYRFARDGEFPFRGRGIGVPTLEGVLTRYPAARTIIEMKQGDPALARAVAAVVRRTRAIDRVCVGSFYRPGIMTLRAEAPEIATSACESEARWTLWRSWARWPFPRRHEYFAFQVPEHAGRMRVVSPAFVRQAHGEEATVQVWVVDTPEQAIRLLDWGVDGLITDRPDQTVPARDRWVLPR